VIADYADAVAAFFVPRPEGAALPASVADGSPARRLRDACEPVAMHAVWSRTTNEQLAQLGLDFLTSYVGGRGASLGDPAGAGVAAAFAWFEPGLVASLWDAARAAVTPARLAQARDEATVASLREVLAGEDPAEVASLLADAGAAADGMGRPLFSGRRADGRPRDAVHCLWWACGLVREHRGWVRDGALTSEGLAARLSIEQHTDAQEQPIVAALGDRLGEVRDRLNHWGQLCVEAGAFPPDILKRAAG